MTTYLITGGSGFIGSNFIRYLLNKDPDSTVINLDKLTYAGNQENLRDIENDSRYHFVYGDICDESVVNEIFVTQKPDIVINFAAESHVDRSIGKPDDFIKTDVFGVFVLLEASKKYGVDFFIQISTDEVYGSIDKGYFQETDQLMPSSPYSATKAGGERLAFSYFVTYNLPVIITRASNNFGPYQYPEKLIPLFITNALENKFLPLYGDGKNVRDWLFVEDHCEAILYLIRKGTIGETYNIGSGNEMQNIEITNLILKYLKKPSSLIKPVRDRLGHDRRYALDCTKLHSLGWRSTVNFNKGMRTTIEWYKSNEEWWEKIKSGEFLDFYKSHYKLSYTS
ncbi:MAG: dTDP-glucose 4,6-dehydratase [Candidatus Marinimicrobia bacterium]|nr:dTDP-glucose 4,6-dehydratase [Candidatus Neomarinimicrobiota bacterium]